MVDKALIVKALQEEPNCWRYIGKQVQKKQTSVACYTIEAEYIAAGKCYAHIPWIHIQLLDYGLNLSKTPIYCDDTSVIWMIRNPVQYAKTKHIEISCYFIKDIVPKGKLELFYISSTNQLADIFIKALGEKPFNKLIVDIGML